MDPRKTKILLIDDEVSFCRSVKMSLELIGDFAVSTCSDSAAAFEQARQLRPDLILLDNLMPGVSGPKLAELFKNTEETKTIPLIFLSALPLKQEGTDYMMKPVPVEVLKSKIEDVLSRSGRK